MKSPGVVFAEWLVIAVGGKVCHPMLQQEWENLSLSNCHLYTPLQNLIMVMHAHNGIVNVINAINVDKPSK